METRRKEGYLLSCLHGCLKTLWYNFYFFYFMAFFSSEDNQTKREDDALAKWVADPANTAWMESKYQ